MTNTRHVVLALLAVTFVPATYACGDDEGAPASPGADASLETSTTDSSSNADTSVLDVASQDVAVDTNVLVDGGDAGDAADAADAALTNNSAWVATSGLMPQAACAPWTLINTANPEVPVLASGILTLATSANVENMYYRQGAAELITPAQLVIEATMRLVSGAASAASRAPVQIAAFRYGSPLRKNIVFVAASELFLLNDENTKGPSTSTADAGADAGTDVFHDYRITVNTTTHAIEVFRDNVSVLTGTAYLDPDGSTERDISWGEGSNFAFGVSEWKRFTHNAHVLGPCP